MIPGYVWGRERERKIEKLIPKTKEIKQVWREEGGTAMLMKT